jgi:hypothetical protein
MKKFLILTLVVLLMLVTVVPAMAGGNTLQNNKTGSSGKQLYALAGYIKAIDTKKMTITVEVAVGNTLVEKNVDIANKEQVVIQTTNIDGDPTRLLLSGGTVIKFDYFKVGQTVSSNGILTYDEDGKEVWAADRITVGALLLSK